MCSWVFYSPFSSSFSSSLSPPSPLSLSLSAWLLWYKQRQWVVKLEQLQHRQFSRVLLQPRAALYGQRRLHCRLWRTGHCLCSRSAPHRSCHWNSVHCRRSKLAVKKISAYVHVVIVILVIPAQKLYQFNLKIVDKIIHDIILWQN